MEDLDQRSQEESLARVVWAAHILVHLTGRRSHRTIAAQPLIPEESDSEDLSDYIDDATEKNAGLYSPSDSAKKKFLLCIAQLLSPATGWDFVTATALREGDGSVDIDVARNDGFGTIKHGKRNKSKGDSHVDEEIYFKEFTEFLQVSQEPGTESERLQSFTHSAIEYTRDRIKYHIMSLRKLLGSSIGPSNVTSIPSTPWNELLCALSDTEDTSASLVQESVVMKAFACIKSLTLEHLLVTHFEPPTARKLWRTLRMLARPVSDCHMVREIAGHMPQFARVRLNKLPTLQGRIVPRYRVDVCEAWRLLSSRQSLPQEEATRLVGYKTFARHCSQNFGLHSEMQLVANSLADPTQVPTLNYFGCSKRSCLLCEHFLASLSPPISTRGRHGTCFPAWISPPCGSTAVRSALLRVEEVLVQLVRICLTGNRGTVRQLFENNVSHSTAMSDLSESMLRTSELRQHVTGSQRHMEEKRAILEGRKLVPTVCTGPFQLDVPDSCVMCNNPKATRCARCQSSYYCSKLCQETDWPLHRLLCGRFSRQEQRPTQHHKRAIFFPVRAKEPRAVWVARSRDLKPWLGHDQTSGECLQIQINTRRNRNFGTGRTPGAFSPSGYVLKLTVRDRSQHDGSEPNDCLRRATETLDATIKTPLLGPMILLREDVVGESYQDVELGDFRHVVDYLSCYSQEEIREASPNLPPVGGSIRGVKICCTGEMRRLGSPPCVQVEVLRGHAIRVDLGCHGWEICPMSRLLDMPIRVWRNMEEMEETRSGRSLHDEDDIASLDNQPVTFMMTETSLSHPRWGWAPFGWQQDVGSVILVRHDEKDLALEDVGKMYLFAQWKLQPAFEDALAAADLVARITKQQALDLITWDNMSTFWKEMEAESGKAVVDGLTDENQARRSQLIRSMLGLEPPPVYPEGTHIHAISKEIASAVSKRCNWT